MVSGEKRNNEEEYLMGKVTTVLLDIEGTTTSVSFVKETLFPYVKEHLESYVESHWDDPEFKEDLAALKDQAKIDEQDKVEGFCPIEEGEKEKESVIKNVLWQMSVDRKTTALKQLQGLIWREGYKNGKLKGHVYSDVAPVLKKWCEENRRVYIFSSGSVEAQKLLFGHSEEGNLLEYISGYFDTTIGSKSESSSYSNIIKSVECEKEQILFLTDIVKEAKAARAAGMKTVLVIRENNAPLSDEERSEFTTITSFDELTCENAAKRKKLGDTKDGELAEKQSEKETSPECNDTSDKSQVNGSEAMEVDVTKDESKSECAESNQNSTDKTTKKTDDENKTETEDIEIDVVSEDRKEEESVDVCTANGEGSDGKSPDQQENSANLEKEDSSAQEDAKESVDSEPQVDVTDPTQEILDAADPLDITSEKTQENNGPVETAAPENESSVAEKEEPVDTVELKNGKLDANSKGDKTPETESSETQASEDKVNESDGEKTGAATAEEPDAENSTENDVKPATNEKVPMFSDDKEVNGQAAYDESTGNGAVEDENISLNKIVPEDKPEPTVEVKA